MRLCGSELDASEHGVDRLRGSSARCRPGGTVKGRAPIVVICLVLCVFGVVRAAPRGRLTPRSYDLAGNVTLIGRLETHTVRPGETFLDIARKYDLAISVLQAFHPDTNPWVLDEGSLIQVPAMWILPAVKRRGIVINVPEMRLYRFSAGKKSVSTYPITVGEKETPTPIGVFRVSEKKVDPQWDIPPTLQHKYKEKSVPPGDDNPIGKYWLGLSRRGYGIHGTDNPWSVGRVISNGCIRLYPEDIEILFPETPTGTIVEIVYQPVKFGVRGRVVFMEVHDDLYGLVGDLEQHARRIAKKLAIENHVDWQKVRRALDTKSGVPVPVGALPKGGDMSRNMLRHR
jgi:L,D-transpeptidase ErfK/SrfK